MSKIHVSQIIEFKGQLMLLDGYGRVWRINNDPISNYFDKWVQIDLPEEPKDE